MTQELVDKFVLSARGTFLEEDRNSNFLNKNTLLMTDNNHSITPPPELFKQWEDDILNERDNVDHVLDCAWRNGFQAGADQELEACCELLKQKGVPAWSLLRLHRRPKPPSLKQQALQALANADGADHPVVTTVLTADQHALIRKALEQLDD